MDQIQYLKGIHPGIVLERELRKRKLSKVPFALSVDEYPQMLDAIIKGEKRKQSSASIPNLKKFRPALFWDTAMDKIDWIRQKRAVIERVWERGTLSEKKERLRFYGKLAIKQVMIQKSKLSL